MLMRKQLIAYFSVAIVGIIANLFFPYYLILAEDGRPESTVLNVPYVKQIPTGQWSDPMQRDGCEEASILMALAWARGGTIPPEEAQRDIVNMSEYENVVNGYYQDTSIEDTAKLMKDYYGFENFSIKRNISSEDIKQELAAGNLVIIPVNTRLTRLRMYRNGPLRHTIVAIGYDDRADTIIVDDSFYGAFKSIPAQALDRALSDYNSGNHLPDTNPAKPILIIYR